MLIAIAPESPSISTCPSAGERATSSAATTPPAPGRFSTTNGLPRLSASLAASIRARTDDATHRTMIRRAFISPSLVHEARRLDVGFEIFRHRAARQQRDFGRD